MKDFMKQKLWQAKDKFSFDTENGWGQFKKVMKKPVMEMVLTPARHVHEMSGKITSFERFLIIF